MSSKPGSMDERSLLVQLRSAGGRRAALTYLRRLPPSTLPDEVEKVLRELLEHGDDTIRRDDVVHVLLRHPSESLRDIYEQVACRELQHLRAQALEHLDFWSKRVPLGDATARILDAAASSEFPWLRFLAAVQSARLGLDNGEGWRRAATEIVASRVPDPMRCIRPQAEEQLSHDERARVNAELRALGARPL